MSLDVGHLVTAVLETAYFNRAATTVKMDIGLWSEQEIRGFTDGLLEGVGQYKVRLKGVRTDTAGFRRYGIDQDYSNAGTYKGVPIVMTDRVDFDVAEFVFEPLPQP